MAASMEMMIAHWANSGGGIEKAASYVLSAILSEPFGATGLIVVLKVLKDREGNNVKFQKLADTVWAELPKAISETKDGYDAAFRQALAATKS